MAKRKRGSASAQYAAAQWSIFGVLLLSYILVYFHRMATGVVSEDLLEAFAITGTQLGTLSSLYFFVYAFMQLPAGVVADTIGTRTAIVSGNLIAGAGSILFGLAGSFEFACAGRFFVGLGVSVVFVSIMKSNSVWFPEKVFAVMSGLTLFVGNLGSILAAGPLAEVLTYFQWRSVFVAIGLLSLVLAVLGYSIVRNRPEDLGLEPPNTYMQEEESESATVWYRQLRSVVTTLRIWPGFWVQLGMIGGLYSFMGLWGVRYLQDVHGAGRTLAAHHITVMLLSFAMGSLFFGWFSDRIGKRKPIILCCVSGYLLIWLVLMYFPWTPGPAGYTIFAFMGVMGSGFVVTYAAAKEVIHPRLSGMAVSVVNTGCFIGTAVMQPLFGYVVDLSWNGLMAGTIPVYSAADYNNAFFFVIAFALIAFTGALRLRETGARNIVVASRSRRPEM